MLLLGVLDLLGFEVVGEIVGGDLFDVVLNLFGLKFGDCVCVLFVGGGYVEYVVVLLL